MVIKGPPPKGEEPREFHDPNEPLGFGIEFNESWKAFNPEFYPDSLTQVKEKDLRRYGNSCNGQSVSIKEVKNREFHITGVVLRENLDRFHDLIDHDGTVDLITPKAPDGGAECFIKKGELGDQVGWDPHSRQRLFDFTLDLVSTGRDEDGDGRNAIVSAALKENQKAANEARREQLEEDALGPLADFT